MVTRSRKAGQKTSTQQDVEPKAAPPSMEQQDSNPPKIFILPKDLTTDARILSLPNPATLVPSRYLACPEKGFYEFKCIEASKESCRSWLLAPDRSVVVEGNSPTDDGYILQQSDLFIATPIDPLFLVLPALWPLRNATGETVWGTCYDRLFLTDSVKTQYAQLEQVIKASPSEKKLEDLLEQRMRTVCDVRNVGDVYYALNEQRLASELWRKAQNLAEAGLPASLEDKFVRQALEMPVLCIKREESEITVAAHEAADAPVTIPDTEDSISASTSQQSSTTSQPNTDASTPATSFSSETSSDAVSSADRITTLLRRRVALNFILGCYVQGPLATRISAIVAKDLEDFGPLDSQLHKIEKAKQEAQVLRSVSDNVSRKRGMLDDEEALEKADAKRRKKEEEDARKKSMSQGVKKLMKADTSGMKKLSSFFAAKPAGKK